MGSYYLRFYLSDAILTFDSPVKENDILLREMINTLT